MRPKYLGSILSELVGLFGEPETFARDGEPETFARDGEPEVPCLPHLAAPSQKSLVVDCFAMPTPAFVHAHTDLPLWALLKF